MRKNGSRQISVKQYKTTDLSIFAAILLVSELLGYFAVKWFPSSAMFTFSLMVPITLLVMIRWGWPGVFYAVASGLILCLLNLGGIKGIQWASYLIGNSFIALMLIPRYLLGPKKIAYKWWSVALFAIGGWLCVYLGRSIVWAIAFAVSPIDGLTAASGFVSFGTYDILSLPIGVLLMVVFRKLDGMFEDQKEYLTRFDTERREKMRRDEFGDNLEEIDEEALDILAKENDLFEK